MVICIILIKFMNICIKYAASQNNLQSCMKNEYVYYASVFCIPGQKLARTLLRGVLDDLMRLPLLDDHAVVHENDAVCHVSGKRHLVRYDDHRHFLLSKRPDHAQHLARELGVQRGSRLVEAEDVGS